MIKGSTIIYNDAYIDELNRHLNNIQQQYDAEYILDNKIKLKSKLQSMQKKIDESMEFQDTIEEIINIEVPSMTVVKTTTGMVVPLCNVKVL